MKQLIALLLLLCLLAGCASTSNNPDAPSDNGKPDFQAPAAAEPEEEPPAPTRNILDGKEPLDDGGVLWHVPNEAIEDNAYQDLYLYQDCLLAVGLDYNGNPYDGDASDIKLRLALLSLDTGLPLCETTLTGLSSPSLEICGDAIAICDYDLGTVCFLDSALQQTAGYRVSSSYCSFYLNADASVAYCFTPSNRIQAVALPSMEKTTVLENAFNLFTSNRCGSIVTFSYVDGDTQMACYATLNLETGTVEPLPFEGDYYDMAYDGDTWLAGILYSNNRYLYGSDPRVIDTGEAFPSLLNSPTRLLTTAYDDGGAITLSLYGRDGTFLSAYTLADGSNLYTSKPVWVEPYGGYFFTCTDYNGGVSLLFWDLNAPAAGEDLASEALPPAASESGGTTAAQELYDRAAALSETYGVHIKIADQCDTEYFTYTVEQDADYWRITTGLDALEAALSRYPDGFLEQLCYDTCREIEINLTGPLTPTTLPEEEVNGFTSFAAFVEHHDGKHVVVMDLNQSSAIEQNFYHECSHIIDAKLEFDALFRTDALYSDSDWIALNPEGFSYTYDYYTLPEDIYTDDYGNCFTDTYARTFPTEDRARVLEYAMSGWDWIFSDPSYPVLREKLAYYAACIRDAFDTTGWPEVTAWEAPLQNTATGGTES